MGKGREAGSAGGHALGGPRWDVWLPRSHFPGGAGGGRQISTTRPPDQPVNHPFYRETISFSFF